MHTPGPWTIGEDEGTSKAHEILGKRGQCIGCTASNESYEEGNARLIAAAPEMLALLTDWPINMPAEAWNRWHTERRALLARIAGES